MSDSHPYDRFAQCVREGRPITGARVLDCHGHLGGYAAMHIPGSDAEDLVGLMDRLGVEAACLSSLEACAGDYRRGNQMTAEAMAAHPGRIYGYAVINPNYGEEILPEIERCFGAAPFVGLKLHPEWHDYPPNGQGYEPALAYAHERRLVVLSHNWGSAEHLETVSRRFPAATFIQAHTAAAWKGHVPSDFFRVARERPNVYLDLVISVSWYGALERLVDQVGSQKLLFGTDCCFLDPATVLGRVAFARLPVGDKERILGLNMLEILSRRI